METSDSECFESADEDFDLDGNSTTVSSKRKESAIENVSIEKHLKKLDISQPPKSTEVESANAVVVCRNLDVKCDNILRDDSKVVKDKTKDDIVEDKNKEKTHEQPISNTNQFSSLEAKSEDQQQEAAWGWDDDEVENIIKNQVKSESREASLPSGLKRLSPESDLIVETDDKSDWGWDVDDELTEAEINQQPQEELSSTTFKRLSQTKKLNGPDVDDGNNWGWDEDDDWEQTESSKLPKKELNEQDNFGQHKPEDNPSTWSSWGNWGVSSLISTASTLTNHVTQVIESGIGVPDPEELARQNLLQKQERAAASATTEQTNEELDSPLSNTGGFGLAGLGSLVSGVNQITKLVESTGNKVILGGLDTLETIGKKTMEVLQEGDPGLKKKRAFLTIDSDKPVLSQILREAKEKAESDTTTEEKQRAVKRVNYETLFDDHQGLVHLEALEMLSKQCSIKLQTVLENLSGQELQEMQETLEQIKELCELSPEDDEEGVNENTSYEEVEESLKAALSELSIPLTYSKLLTTWAEAEKWIVELNSGVYDEMKLHEKSIDILAQLTALAVENYHKIGELLLVKEHRSTVNEADNLVQLTNILSTLIGQVSKKLSNTLNERAVNSKQSGSTSISELITNIYFEAANSTSYIRDSFQLLLPILQVGVL